MDRARVRELFHLAVQRRPEQREAFVDDACRGDEAMRHEVLSLLAADGEAGSFLERPAFGPGRTALLEPGARLGPWELLGKIGEGGMSKVFLARRVDGEYEKQVAVKIVRHDLATADGQRRFRQERQILARLEHPHIARFLDGGTTAEGLSYLVMEHLRAEPIDVWCDRRRLTLAPRIDLFRQVCAAVHYAHQNLVVHRDLKPSNILVTEEGVPMVVDFGIAKLLDPGEGTDAEATSGWQRLMTPTYASPEQAAGRPVATTSDIYSLGVVLYKLLTGGLPHHFSSTSPREVERVLLENEPKRASLAVLEGADEIAGRRGGRPAELARQLAGDLDDIVSMALAREAEQRYGSAQELAEDLWRWKSGHGVRAHQGSFAYRTAKFLRRNRIAVGVASMFVALALAAAVTFSFQAARIAQERDLATQERSKSEAVIRFLESIFLGADILSVQNQPAAASDELTARQLLDQSAERLEKEFDGQVDVKARLMSTLGRIYRNLGYADRAQHLFERALELRADNLEEEPLEFADSLYFLGTFFGEKSSYAEAEKLVRRSIAIRQEFLGTDHRDLVPGLSTLATILWEVGKAREAEHLHRQVLAIMKREGGDPVEIAKLMAGLAMDLSAQGDHHQALNLTREAHDAALRQLGEDHPFLGFFRNNLGSILFAMGDYEAAACSYEDALTKARLFFSTRHFRLSFLLLGLGRSKTRLGRAEEALPFLREALEIRQGYYPEDHWHIAQAKSALGECLLHLGRPEEARGLLVESYRQLAALRRADSIEVVEALHRLLEFSLTSADKGSLLP